MLYVGRRCYHTAKFRIKSGNLRYATIPEITGTITDAKGEPLLGVNVVVKGTTNGTITDLDGKYVLEVEPNAILVISYIGT